jgi:hypothetical protein
MRKWRRHHRSRPTVSRIRRRLVRPDWETIEKIKKFTDGVSTADDYQNIEVPGKGI